jgi:hypothetical protein
MKILDFYDFRGGFFTDVPSELMQDNELLTAENCQWKTGGIKKRNGVSIYDAEDWSGMAGCKGGIRAYINGAWYTVLALQLDDTPDVVNFYYGTGTTFTTIDATFDWTPDYNVEFAELNGYIVAVNGINRPAVIYYDGGWVVENLETLDTRIRDELNWYAGQWDEGEESFTDDTADAQDAGVDDFALTTLAADADDGCYISCDYVFNYVIFQNAQQDAGATDTDVFYWNGTEWTEITPTTVPDWTAAESDKVLEFDIPLDADGNLLWEVYGEDEDTDGIENRFVLLIKHHNAPTAQFFCDGLVLKHTQYLRQILADERPHTVYAHNNQMFLASNNIVNFSPPNLVTDWFEMQIEYFIEGGRKIQKMISYQDTLVVFKEKTFYTFNVNNLMSPVRSRPLSSSGTIAPRSPAVVGDVLFYVANDGIYLWDGEKSIKVSRHIQTYFDSLTVTNAAGIGYKGEYWVSFPASNATLTCDPDTFRRDSMGEGRVSFFKFTSYKTHQFIYNNGDGDNSYLLGIIDQDEPYLARFDYDDVDNLGSETAITMTLKTRYISPSSPQKKYYWGRLKAKLCEVSGVAGDDYSITFCSEDGNVSEAFTITVTVGTGYYIEEMNMPYTLDDKNFAIELTHSTATAAGFIGFTVSTEERGY